ncbi:DUF5710 domain-containing protein [Moraxella nonliquefaciens]|uniref:DUF5710 domain-containing protein n=1 Tax=Moraxella nonliquefaciens TaxID=478 RepID=UPI001D127ACC|nr:DUF5710 domain-containing protein [Moraxella nonliquefaciens]
MLGLGRNYTPIKAEIDETKEQVAKNPNTNIAQENTPINVPYKQKNEAKALGAKWDSKNKTWYVPTGEDLGKFGKWYSLEQSLPNQKEIRTAWGDFPPVISNGKLRDLSNEPEYQEAKSGNFEQSVKLVDKLIKDETVQHIKEIIGDNKPIIVPILSEEASGKNRIPKPMPMLWQMNLIYKLLMRFFKVTPPKEQARVFIIAMYRPLNFQVMFRQVKPTLL